MAANDGLAPGFDWAQAWRDYAASRGRADDAEFWNNRAPSFAKTAGTSPYARTFLSHAAVHEGETVFDMGSGSGTLALPLARDGHAVAAVDFSSVMLELMMQRAELEGTAGLIDARTAAWDDDWDALGLPVCDVAFASRSIATDDLEAALLKLESRARRRVCITMSSGLSPHVDNVLFRVIRPNRVVVPEYVYAMNILWQLGRTPELRLIESGRPAVYTSAEHALEKNASCMECTPGERALLERYIEENLVPMTTEEGEGFGFTHRRTVTWGFVSWNL